MAALAPSVRTCGLAARKWFRREQATHARAARGTPPRGPAGDERAPRTGAAGPTRNAHTGPRASGTPPPSDRPEVVPGLPRKWFRASAERTHKVAY